MGIFDPKLETQVTPEGAVAQPSTLAGVAQIAQSVGNLLTANAGSSGSGVGDAEKANANFLRDLSQVAQIKDESTRLRYENQLYTNAYAAGVDPEFMAEAQFRATGTIRPLGFESAEEKVMHDFMVNPDNSAYFMAAKGSLGSGATQEDLANEAFRLANADAARGAIVADRALSAEIKIPTAIEQLNTFSNEVLGGLRSSMETGVPVTMNEVNLAKAALANNYNILLQSSGIQGAEASVRAPLEEAYNLQVATLDAMEGVTLSKLSDGNKSVFMANLQEGILSDPDMSTPQKIASLSMLTARFDSLVESGVLEGAGALDVAQWLKSYNTNEVRVDQDRLETGANTLNPHRNPDGTPQLWQPDLLNGVTQSDHDPQATLNRLETLGKSWSRDNPTNLAEDLAIMTHSWKKLGDLDGQFLSRTGTEGNTATMTNAIMELAKSDPNKAATIASQMVENSITMENNARRARQNLLDDSVISIVDGVAVLDEDKFFEEFNLTDQEADTLMALAERNFGGSLQEMLSSRGGLATRDNLNVREMSLVQKAQQAYNETAGNIQDANDLYQAEIANNQATQQYIALEREYSTSAGIEDLVEDVVETVQADPQFSIPNTPDVSEVPVYIPPTVTDDMIPVAREASDVLLEGGLPEHVVQGFLMNFVDESNMDAGINEIAPLVEGSRGGFGLYQLTGPRRRDYEAYADELGVPYNSVEAQMKWLLRELETTETRARDRIMNTSTPQEAAAAIVEYFLRPHPTHMRTRRERYLNE